VIKLVQYKMRHLYTFQTIEEKMPVLKSSALIGSPNRTVFLTDQ